MLPTIVLGVAMMKRTAVGGLAIAALLIAAHFGTANAADMPTKAPVYDPAPAISWTGFYAGINVGAGWASSTESWTVPFFNAAITNAAATTLRPSGAIGGLQLGYNYQIQSIVLGAEADFDETDIGTQRQVPTPPFVNQVNENFSSHWLGTLRARLGIASDRLLFFGTGGLAVARVQLYDGVGFNTSSNSTDQTRSGWVVGGGAEWAFSRQWSLKSEYLYVNLGTITFNSLNSSIFGPTPGLFSHRIDEQIARVGLNYRFN
jgi:outer membrane immunogenic protein